MSLELPWFKFYSQKWNTGDISLEQYEIQGLFISICAYYWDKECTLSYEQLRKRTQDHEGLPILMKLGMLKTVGDAIKIDFLDLQYTELLALRKSRQRGAKKTNEAKNGRSKEDKRTKGSHAERIAKRAPTERYIDIEVDIEDISKSFDSQFWEPYDKKTGRKNCFERWKRLKAEERALIADAVPKYVASTPDPKFRKNPLSYLNGEHWRDEVIPVVRQKAEIPV